MELRFLSSLCVPISVAVGLFSVTMRAPAQTTDHRMPQAITDAPVSPQDLAELSKNLVDPPRYAHGMDVRLMAEVHPPDDLAARTKYLKSCTYRDLGIAYFFDGQPKIAISKLLVATETWPDNVDAYRWLAESYISVGDNADAIKSYRLLFDGWSGRVRDVNLTGPMPPDRASNYNTVSSEETDPISLLQFSLLLQEDGDDAEARQIYDRAMSNSGPLFSDPLLSETDERRKPHPATSSSALATDADLKVATLLWLGAYQEDRDFKLSKGYFDEALQLNAGNPTTKFYETELDDRIARIHRTISQKKA